MSISEDKLIFTSVQKGDNKAFKVLFTKYYLQLCHYALLYVNDQSIAESLVQDVFINIWEKRQSLDIHSSIKAYLFISVKNRSLNYLRNRPQMLEFEDWHTEIESEEIFSSENNINYSDLKAEINKSIQKLPGKCREIFLLSREENMSYREIAEKLNISRKTVENQLGIALKKLREQLKPYLGIIFLSCFSYIKYFI